MGGFWEYALASLAGTAPHRRAGVADQPEINHPVLDLPQSLGSKAGGALPLVRRSVHGPTRLLGDESPTHTETVQTLPSTWQVLEHPGRLLDGHPLQFYSETVLPRGKPGPSSGSGV